MRILYVSSDFGVPVFGHKGASVHLRAMTRALVETGNAIQIVSPSSERMAHLDFDLPVGSPVDLGPHTDALREIRRVDRSLGPLPTGHESRMSQEIRNIVYNGMLGRSAAAFCDFRPDLVYERYSLFGFGGLELARQLDVPHVLEVNAPLCVEHERARGLHLADVAHAVETQTWRTTDALCVVSEELAEQVGAQGVAPENVHVVPNGVDPALFAPRPEAGARRRRELGLGDGPVLGFAGSLKSWHGTELLVRACAALVSRWPTARLLLVGEGPEAPELRARVCELGLENHVVFTGAVEHTQVPELLSALDVAVAPYLPTRDFYFSPIKVYEYMAVGIPVVASRIGQITALADEGLVVGAEPGDIRALERALETVLATPREAATRATRARDWVLQHRTWTANAKELLEIAGACTASRA